MAGLLGSLLITMDTGGACGEGCSPLSGSAGDWAILAAALLYSVSTVRLGVRASQFDAIHLATSKTLALAVLSAGWVVVDAAGEWAVVPNAAAKTPLRNVKLSFADHATLAPTHGLLSPLQLL